jgi:hypothetical protein
MASFDEVEERQRWIDRPRRRRLLPPPRPAAVAAAVAVLEVRAGLRPAGQLERLSHYSLWPAWPTLAPPAAAKLVPSAPRLRAMGLREVVPGLVDATVVIELAGRAHALGLRLDGAPGFWQLVELDYPVDWTGLDLQAVTGPLHVRTRLDGDPWSPRSCPPVRPREWPLLQHRLVQLEAPGIELE